MMPLTPDQTTLAVIAGGQGRRMGGPKHGLHIHGEPALRFIARRLRWPGPTILVLAERQAQPEGAGEFQRVIHDNGVGEGPLRALASALEAGRSPALITVPVDMPCVNRAALEWLIKAIEQRPEARGILLSRGEGVIEPFPAIFRAAAAPALRSMLRQGRLAIRDLSTHADFKAVPAPEEWPESTWLNLNEPRDLPDWVKAPG